MSSSTHVVECHFALCHRSFKSQESMLQHYTDTHSHPPQDRLSCSIEHCNKSFHSQHDLENHLRDAHHLDPLTAAAAAAAVVDDHQRILAPDLQPADLPIGNVACNDCGRTFRTTDSLHQHQWNSTDDHTRVSKSRNPNSGSSLRTCSQCGEKFSSAERLEEHFVDKHPICEVPKSSQAGTWQHVAERFRTAWKKPSIKLYAVDRIFKVYNPGWRREGFEEYRKKLKEEMADILKEDDQLELRNKVLANGNELRCYHGTTVECQLGRPPPKAMDTELAASSLCTSMNCNMCRILQKGFKLSKCKVERFQRFGKGIYSSTISSKASAYVNCSSSGVGSTNKRSFWSWIGIGGDDKEVNSNYKVMIACKVLAGRPYRHATSNLKHLNGPPSGFHSVQGDPGVVLNYEETVVYDDRAILPEFIILYSSSD